MNNALGRPKKKKIISRLKGYHGVTVASGSLTGLPANHTDFDLPIAGVMHVSYPHHYRFALDGETEQDYSARLAAELNDTIEREGPETVAAFIAEPIMRGGGAIVPPNGYFEAIQAVLARHDVRMILDEVITGLAGRARCSARPRSASRPTACRWRRA
jgi:4-aminobutyrate---pyruvate transaminase